MRFGPGDAGFRQFRAQTVAPLFSSASEVGGRRAVGRVGLQLGDARQRLFGGGKGARYSFRALAERPGRPLERRARARGQELPANFTDPRIGLGDAGAQGDDVAARRLEVAAVAIALGLGRRNDLGDCRAKASSPFSSAFSA